MNDLETALLPGERLLWTGRPARARVNRADLRWPALLLLALVVSAVTWTGHGPANTPAMRTSLALFALADATGLAVLAIRALHLKPKAAQHVTYQLTDRRIIVTTGGPRPRSVAAFLDQLAEPALISQRDGTADLIVRDFAPARGLLQKLLDSQRNRQGFAIAARQPFPVLHDLPDAELVRQQISAARQRMLNGMLEVPPARVMPGDPPPPDFMPVPGEELLWVGHPEQIPWWFGADDAWYSAYFGMFLVLIPAFIAWALQQRAPALPIIGFCSLWLVVFWRFALGRVLRRHARIERSTYILTSERLIATWPGASGSSGTERPLAQLLPPELSGTSLFMNLAWASTVPSIAPGQLLWPASTVHPPQLIGLSDPEAVAQLICAAQLAERARTWSRAAR
jgi:hypothetical protein